MQRERERERQRESSSRERRVGERCRENREREVRGCRERVAPPPPMKSDITHPPLPSKRQRERVMSIERKRKEGQSVPT